MIVCHLQESFLNRTEREGKFEMLLEQNKNKIDKLTDIRQELDLELLKVKFSGRYIMRKFARMSPDVLLCSGWIFPHIISLDSANDAERDEIQECKEEIARVRREVQQKKLKMYAVDTNLIRVRSSQSSLLLLLKHSCFRCTLYPDKGNPVTY
jgi:hypothetical protein